MISWTAIILGMYFYANIVFLITQFEAMHPTMLKYLKEYTSVWKKVYFIVIVTILVLLIALPFYIWFTIKKSKK